MFSVIESTLFGYVISDISSCELLFDIIMIICISMIRNVIRLTFIGIISILYIFILLCFSSVVIVFIYCWACFTKKAATDIIQY